MVPQITTVPVVLVEVLVGVDAVVEVAVEIVGMEVKEVVLAGVVKEVAKELLPVQVIVAGYHKVNAQELNSNKATKG